MGVRKQAPLRRQWELIFALHRTSRGLSVAQLVETLESSRATVYRDLAFLQSAGCPITSDSVNGSTRYKLSNTKLPELQITEKQLAAIFVGRSLLAGLEGTSLVRELDTLFRGARGRSFASAAIAASRPRVPWVSHVGALEAAIERGRRVRMRYRGRNDVAARWRLLDPLRIRVVDGNAYLIAYDLDVAAVRTFKLVRTSSVQVLNERIDKHAAFDEDALFRNSAKVWSAPVVDVIVRLSPSAKRFAHEYPLHPSQSISDEPDGSAIVRATVAGTVEAMRWVLSWGGEAEVIAPVELRDAVCTELAHGLRNYDVGAAKPSRSNVSQAVRSSRLTRS